MITWMKDTTLPELKLIIAGSRSFTSRDVFEDILYSEDMQKNLEGRQVSIVCGMARHGVDNLVKEYALSHHIKLYKFPADWGRYGHAAGPMRNRDMAAFGDGLLAIWDGVPRGTKNMIEEMRKLEKPVRVEAVAAARRASEAQRLKEDCANLNGENPDSAVFSTIYAKTEEYTNPHVIGEFQTVFEENQRFADNIVEAYRNDKASGIL